MATVHIRNVADGLVSDLRVEAIRSGVTFRELVISALEMRNGHGKTEGNIGAQGMPGVRGGVPHDPAKQGRARGSGTMAVQRPFEGAPVNASAVDYSAQQDSVRERASEGIWLGPKHAKDCQCKQCKERNG
jgi:hypothetical protein